MNVALDGQEFLFDAVFGPEAQQAEVFDDCADLVQSAVDGFNVTIFAYGQTGAGKTHTMYGTKEEPGIAPNTFNEIFKMKERDKNRMVYTVKAYMVELYRD